MGSRVNHKIRSTLAVLISLGMLISAFSLVPLKPVHAINGDEHFSFPIEGYWTIVDADEDGLYEGEQSGQNYQIRWRLKTRDGRPGELELDILDKLSGDNVQAASTEAGYKYIADVENMQITKLKIDAQLKTIPAGAFSDENGLEVFDLDDVAILPSSVRKIEKEGFRGNPRLKELKFNAPEKLEYIGAWAFVDCGFEEIDMTAFTSLETIDIHAFWKNKDLKKLKLPDNLKYLGDFAFADCEKLSGNVDLPSKLEHLGDAAFSETQVSGNLSLPLGLKYLGNAFGGCSGITGNVSVPASAQLSRYIFEGTGITGLTINSSNDKQYITNDAFCGMTELKSVNIGSGIKVICDGAFNGCTSLTTVNFGGTANPSRLKLIAGGAFSGCTSLTSITLPEGLQYIGYTDRFRSGESVGAFQGTGLEQVVIPASVRFIGNLAFAQCNNLKKVVIVPGNEDVAIGLPVSETYDEEGNLSIDMSLYNGISWIVQDNGTGYNSVHVTDFYYGSDIEGDTYKMEVAVNGEGESFAYCENLEEVWIPSNVKYIRNKTFTQSPKVVKKDYSNGETPDIDTGSSSGGSGDAGGTGADTGTGSVTPCNEWIDGKWYDASGVQSYDGILSWKHNENGWWVEDSNGWYPKSAWQKIDEKWYYFNADGYMASNEWIDGYWLGADGAMAAAYFITWKCNASGWWIEDKTGWSPSSQWQKIGGKWYYFNENGYMVTNQYVDGYWIGADGVCN